MIYVKRNIEKRLKKLINQFPIVGILGPRQIGKTTLSKEIKLPNQKDYIDLELSQDIIKLGDPELYFEINKDKSIVLDEIQRMPSLFTSLRGMIDRDRISGRFLILGSVSQDILKKSTETLAGRIAYIEITGINILELPKNVSWKNHWLRGGFPEPLLSKSDDFVIEWHRFFINTYIQRDLTLLGLNATPTSIYRFISIIATSQGSIFNATNYSKSLGLTRSTINKYIDIFESTYLIRRLQPFYRNVKKRLIKSPKIYIRDCGILHNILGIYDFNKLLGHTILGNSFENYVIEQIISYTNNLYDYFFYRTQDGTECDLVIAQAGNPLISIEIKFTSTPKKTKSFINSIKDLETTHNYIIIPFCETPYPMTREIIVCDLKYFLKKIDDILKY